MYKPTQQSTYVQKPTYANYSYFTCITPSHLSNLVPGSNLRGVRGEKQVGRRSNNIGKTLGYIYSTGALDNASATTLSDPFMCRISSQCDCRNSDHLTNLWLGHCNEFKNTKGL